MSDTDQTASETADASGDGLSQAEVDERFAWLFSTFEMATLAEMLVDGLFYPLSSDAHDTDRKVIEFRVTEAGTDGDGDEGEVSMLDITEHVNELEIQADHAAGPHDD